MSESHLIEIKKTKNLKNLSGGILPKPVRPVRILKHAIIQILTMIKLVRISVRRGYDTGYELFRAEFPNRFPNRNITGVLSVSVRILDSVYLHISETYVLRKAFLTGLTGSVQ